MRHLLAVDMGLRTGLALYREDRRLLWYRSQHFGNRARLKRGVHQILREIDDLAWLVVEGGGLLQPENNLVKKIDQPLFFSRGNPMATWSPKVRIERRNRPDFWARSLEWFVVGGWFLMLVALLVLSLAKPQVETFFDRYYQIPLRRFWDDRLLVWLEGFMVAGFCLGLIGLLINWRRHRRETDEYRVSLVLISAISLIGLLVHFLRF